jgi:hypothetical protein
VTMDTSLNNRNAVTLAGRRRAKRKETR